MPQSLTHGAILRRYRFVIGGTFLLLAAENLLRVLEPFFLGRAIDGLIAGNARDLWIFVGLAMTSLAIGVFRRVYDTRVYGRIYRETASDMVDAENAKDAPVTQVTARAAFVSEFSEFFELYLPMAVMAFATLAGAIVMLFVISPAVCAGAVAAALGTGFMFFFSRRRIAGLNASMNDEMERQVDILSTRDSLKAQTHFSSLVRWRVLLSDLEARNFGAAFFLTIALAAYAVYVLVAVESRTEGQIFAALTYILQFTEALVMLPYSYQQFLRTKEISDRLRAA